MGLWNVLSGLRRNCTDVVATQIVLKWVNFQMGETGRMINLQIDSKQKSIRLELELKGETEPIRIEVPKYEIIEKDGAAWIQFETVHVSREWMQHLAENYLKEKQFEIPAALKMAL